MPAELPAAVVFTAESDRRLVQAGRALRKQVVVRSVALSARTACAELEDPPSEQLRQRLARKGRGSAELRLDCDVAWTILGRGYILLTVTQPASALQAVLETHTPTFRDIAWPSDREQPVRVCLPRLAVPDPLALAADLRAEGLLVEGVYEVGACRR